MSYAPIVARTLTNGLASFGDVEDSWTNSPWVDDNDNEYNTPETAASHSRPTRNQIESKGSTNGAQGHTHLHTRASTASVIDSSGRSGLRSRKVSAHRRAATAEDSTAISLSDSKVAQARTHPLQVPKTPTDRDAFVTRPSLKRWLSNGANSISNLDDAYVGTQEDGYSEWTTQTKEAETMVIVHEVSKSDSLAGVALKYGIALADLRRVNHLWASDPIHLRKVLYIPVHLTSKKLAIAESQLLNGQHMSAEEDPGSSISSTLGQSSPSIVQRVPVSQLSFFPPSSSSKSTITSPSLYSTNPGLSYNGSNPYATSPRISRARSASSGGASGPSLSSFIQAIQQQFAIPPLPLPLPLSRPRISLDSTDVSSSTGTAAASESSSDQEHEMDVLGRYRTRTSSQSPREGPTGESLDLGSKGLLTKSGEPSMAILIASSNKTPKRRSAADLKKYAGTGRDSSRSTSIPSQLQPPISDPVPLVPVTEQLKPSPRMELPRSSS